jgi:colanic acid/amylovoran biosynthesis glycosyltransferase
MKIAYLINQYPAASHSFIRREVQELERQGLSALRIALRGSETTLVDAGDRAEQQRTHYILGGGGKPRMLRDVAITMLTRPVRFAGALRTALWLGWRADRPLPYHLVYLAEACSVARLCSAGGIDHLHAHFGSNPAEIALLAAKLAGIPFSFTVHGPEEFDKPGTLKLAAKVAAAKFVVAISSFGRSQLYRWLAPADRAKVRIVHCGLQDGFAAGDLPPAPAAPRFVCVGRLSEQKGHFVLLDACRILAERGVEFEVELIGDGELRSQVEARIAEYGLGAHVSIAGWCDEARVRAALLDAKALILASFAEGLPVVIMEAMALRRPVVTTYIAGIPELVRDGIDGFLVPAGDAAALADAMAQVLDLDADALAGMGASGQARALERHSIATEAAKLAEAFRS